MIDKKTKIDKIIDPNRFVFHCVRCGHEFIGSIEYQKKCPSCNKADTVVIRGDYIVMK